MRNYKLRRSAKGAAEVKLAAGAETVAVTLTNISTDAENGQVEIEAVVPFTTPAESTEQRIRLYRGGVGGTEIATVTVKAGASAKACIPLNFVDEPGEVVNQAYTVTVQDVAGKETIVKEATIKAQY